MVTLVDGLNRLISESKAYADEFRCEEPINIEINLTDTQESAILSIHQDITLGKEASPDLKLYMTQETFNRILYGEADFGAMIGRSKLSEKRPIDFEILNPAKANKIIGVLYPLMTMFFTPGSVKVKNLNKSMAGEAHGAHPIPLVYWNGIRYAWYHIGKGETLNEAGEKDSYPQTFQILKGAGKAIIGETAIEIHPGQSIYIPANLEHKVKAYEDIDLLWLAWKTPLI